MFPENYFFLLADFKGKRKTLYKSNQNGDLHILKLNQNGDLHILKLNQNGDLHILKLNQNGEMHSEVNMAVISI